jgi:hypothetical protein
LLLVEVPPQLVSDVSTAVWDSSASVAEISPISDGATDHNRATEPATCGDAMDVPL